MPELPEVETVCRGLTPALSYNTISHVDQNRPNLRIPFPDNMPYRLQNKTIETIKRRAKYILINLNDGQCLIIHLGMSGRITINNADTGYTKSKHDHMVLHMIDGTTIVYNDARRFGMVDLCLISDLDQHKFFKDLGPEPLGNHFNSEYLFEKLNKKKTPIKNALLDQHTVSGLGNIYVCEALYRSFIHPARKSCDVTQKECDDLVKHIRDILNEAIEAGGSSLKDYVQASGELGYFQHSFLVYGRNGEPCKKNKKHVIEKITQSGRSSFYCPLCQK